MATRGRKPTPTAIKELEGNPGKRKINEAEPKPEKKRLRVRSGWSRKQRRNGGGYPNSWSRSVC